MKYTFRLIMYTEELMDTNCNSVQQRNANNVDINGNILTNIQEQVDDSDIKRFYDGASIFVTGGTGFVGKALIEKLLRTFRKIRSIYLLMRPKYGQSVEERRQQFLLTSVFDRIRNDKELSSSIMDKVYVINGDVKKPNLGISENDLQVLRENVTIVFHSAATVKFNECLSEAVSLNTLGTHRVLLFCKKLKKLKVFIHVSTAYSNVDKSEILEKVYPIPESTVFKKMDKLWDESLNEQTFMEIGAELQEKHPNTYTVTKAMAEWVVSENAGTLSIAIVRPSIVTAAWREPYQGWVDNVNGITGIMMEVGRGTIRSIICDQRLVVDIIPVDFVVNTLITAAWYTVTYCPGAVKVYNCTSGSSNPISWEELGALTVKHVLKMPSQYTQWYPGFTYRTNKFIHFLCEQLFHYLPAFVIDAVLRMCGSKPIMLKIYAKFKTAAQTGQFFALHQWNFSQENMSLMQKRLKRVQDNDFYIDISKLEWNDYIRNYVFGIRSYVLKESLDTIPSSRKKLQRLYWANKCLQAAVIVAILKIIR